MNEHKPFVLNKDIETRDNIIFPDGYQPKKYSGGCREFDNLTYEQAQKLVEQSFIDTRVRYNGCPTIMHFIDFMETHPGFTAHGYTVSLERNDYRVTIEGLLKEENISKEDIVDFANAFHSADEFEISNTFIRCWYD